MTKSRELGRGRMAIDKGAYRSLKAHTLMLDPRWQRVVTKLGRGSYSAGVRLLIARLGHAQWPGRHLVPAR